MMNPVRILVRLVLNRKFLEIISRCCATLSAIGCTCNIILVLFIYRCISYTCYFYRSVSACLDHTPDWLWMCRVHHRVISITHDFFETLIWDHSWLTLNASSQSSCDFDHTWLPWDNHMRSLTIDPRHSESVSVSCHIHMNISIHIRMIDSNRSNEMCLETFIWDHTWLTRDIQSQWVFRVTFIRISRVT